jgi:undecaprenyl-diphosphatase
MEWIENFDRALFFFINGMQGAFPDFLMHWLSNRWIWIPLYLVLAVWVYRKFGRRSGWIFFLMAGLIFVSDQSAGLFKNNLIQRYRPCHNLEMVKVNGECGGKYGFYSAHASNTFALAGFLFFLWGRKFTLPIILIFLWAFLVSLSRIYNGVHYPTDVFTGALAGIILARLAFFCLTLIERKNYRQL